MVSIAAAASRQLVMMVSYSRSRAALKAAAISGPPLSACPQHR